MTANCSRRGNVFAVFAAPVQPVALRQFDGRLDRLLRLVHRAGQVAALDAELDSDVTRIIFAIDERRAVALTNRGQLGNRNLLPGRSGHQQIADGVLARTVLGFHAHHQVEQLLALNHLRGGLPAHRSLDHALDIGDIDAVTRDLVAIHVDLHAGLPQFAHHGEFGEARHLLQHAFDLDRFIFEYLQIRAKDFYGQRALQAGERLIHGVFGGLGEVENHSGIRIDFFLKILVSSALL
jgi:hypothetical protein